MIDILRDNLIDFRTVAERFNVTPATVHNWRKDGMECQKIGRRSYRTTWDAVERFIRGNQETEEQDDLAELRARFGTTRRN